MLLLGIELKSPSAFFAGDVQFWNGLSLVTEIDHMAIALMKPEMQKLSPEPILISSPVMIKCNAGHIPLEHRDVASRGPALRRDFQGHIGVMVQDEFECTRQVTTPFRLHHLTTNG
ncbi:unnamed protein product [Dicrocoelium dendriticum]|nr:unnamed protein product [Dicrocoelium dendriticum]